MTANMELYRKIGRENAMFYPALEELMKDDLNAHWQAGRQAGLLEGRQEGRQEGVILGTANVYRKILGLDNAALTGKIAAEFHLTAEQAAEYVRLSQEA